MIPAAHILCSLNALHMSLLNEQFRIYGIAFFLYCDCDITLIPNKEHGYIL